MNASVVSSISELDAGHWNTLVNSDTLFLQHDFLLALEQHDCLSTWGWQAVYFALHENNELVGACASYIKTNSYGEFVFDWAWADAYQRNGLEYYPKLVTAIPFTPATGARLLARNDDPGIKQQLLKLVLGFCKEQQLSSAHFLFCNDHDMDVLTAASLLTRFDYQFHWHNQNYACFDEFLAALNAKRRKNIKRERRLVAENNIHVEIIPGNDLSDAQWQKLYDFYRVTFLRKSGAPTFTLEFFRAVAHYLRAVFAYENNTIVAGAILYEGNNTLYGRHWGSLEHYDQLHFEVCYYAGIEYCIKQGIARFEPGAQGEHKIWRGFLPTRTRSAHWIAHPGFREAIAEFLQREASSMQHYGEQLQESNPYRQTGMV